MTELVWEGKYDKDGRRAVPLRVTLPFQTVETINESSQDRQRSLDHSSIAQQRAYRRVLIGGNDLKAPIQRDCLPEHPICAYASTALRPR
jgi:hypothetical protein